MSSSLMGVIEKTRAVQFFAWVNNYREKDPATHSAGIFRKRVFKLPECVSRILCHSAQIRSYRTSVK